jgi:hypothetical protein
MDFWNIKIYNELKQFKLNKLHNLNNLRMMITLKDKIIICVLHTRKDLKIAIEQDE